MCEQCEEETAVVRLALADNNGTVVEVIHLCWNCFSHVQDVLPCMLTKQDFNVL